MVEFALSSVVLLVLVSGLVDIGRAVYVSEALSNAAREGARHGIWYDSSKLSHPYLYDAEIKSAVDAELATISLPASVLKNPVTTCPAGLDNTVQNPPYASSAYPTTANQPWLYICYNHNAATDYTSPPSGVGRQDLNVIVLYVYAPLTAMVNTQFTTIRLATNVHMTVQGS